MRAEFEKLRETEANPIDGIEDSDELKIALLNELQALNPNAIEDFEKKMDEEFSVFKEGNNYNYVKDLKDAFSVSMAKPRSLQILETIPDHAFWDIKTPTYKPEDIKVNPYNPFRKYPFESFFDFRDYEEYMDRRRIKNNLTDGLTLNRRY